MWNYFTLSSILLYENKKIMSLTKQIFKYKTVTKSFDKLFEKISFMVFIIFFTLTLLLLSNMLKLIETCR